MYVLFKIINEFYILPIEHVREVIKTTSISPLPKAPYFVEGIATVREHNILVINLFKKLTLKTQLEPKNEYFIIISIKNMIFALLVDKVLDIISVESFNEDISSKEIQLMSSDVVEKIIPYKKNRLFLLNAAKLIDSDEEFKLTELNRQHEN